MKHPSEETLALHAGNDLGWVARWSVGRHLAACDRCRREVAAFAALRATLPELGGISDLPWDRLASEMQSNIRRELAVREVPAHATEPRFQPARLAWGAAAAAVLIAAGVFLDPPAPRVIQANDAWVQATANGIQSRTGDRSFSLLNEGAGRVTYTAGAQGTIGARYTDPETGTVTMTKVYVE
jgi:anti-sigma factor RsiW